MWDECGTHEEAYVPQDAPAKQHLSSYHVPRSGVNDISDLIIVSEKTKSRFFRCCIEMIKRIEEGTEMS